MAFQPNPLIYTELLTHLTLSDRDRNALKERRGFTDATIDSLKFKTSCKSNEDVIKSLLDKHGFAKMYECGLVDKNRNASWQFTHEDLIIIPYLEHNDQCYFYKSHKRAGLDDSGVMPYCNKLFAKKEDYIVLCESEFKAAAMWQMGFRAIGLGGVASFTGQHMPTLAKMLDNIPKIIVLFDTEIQDDPSLVTFKDDYRRRYAQLIWSYILAKKLHNYINDSNPSPVDVRIASLPNEWVVDGKADIDGCVASGKGRDDFAVILNDALEPEAYKSFVDIKKEHRPWIMRRMESAFKNNKVFVKDNCTFTHVKVSRGKKEIRDVKEIANFKIELVSTTHFNNETYRDVRLTNRFGDITKTFHLRSDQLAQLQKFKDTCLKSGDFLWKGTEQDFNDLLEMLFLETEAYPVKMLDYVGRIEDDNAWAFANMMIFDDGTIVESDPNESFFQKDDKSYRIKWQNDDSKIMLSKEPIDIQKVIEDIELGWGFNGLIVLGHTIANLFSNPYFDAFRCFPIPMLFGEAKSGKSTLSDLMGNVLGFGRNVPSLNISNTTPVAMARKLAFYSSLPVRFDEHRQGDRKIEDKYSLIRSLYNRQSSAKGVRGDVTTTYEVKVRGNMFFTGEQRPTDAAVMSRCVPTYYTTVRHSAETLKAATRLNMLGEKLSYITYKILTSYQENVKKFMENCIDTRSALADKYQKVVDFRTQQHYAAVLAGMSIILPIHKVAEVASKVVDACVSQSMVATNESAYNEFWSDVLAISIEPNNNVSGYVWNDGDRGYIYMQGVYNEWQRWKHLRNGSVGMQAYNSVKQHLKSQPFFVRDNLKKSPPRVKSDRRVLCIELDLSLDGVTKEILSLFNMDNDAQEVQDEAQ